MGARAPVWTVFVHEYVTGGGLSGSDLPASWAAEGAAMRRALVEDFAGLPGHRVVVTLDDRLHGEPGPWTTVRVGASEQAATFARLSAEAEYTALIAPEAGGILLDRARAMERAGGRSLGSTPGAIALAGDKLRLGEHLAAIGIATPPGRRVVPADGLPRAFDYPAVLKPIDGAGSVDTYYLESADACPAGALALREALLQPFVAGLPMSASFLVAPGGRANLIGLARQRIERAGVRISYRGGTVPAQGRVDLGGIRLAIESVAGLQGWVGVDFVLDEATGRATVLEINPRLTTSYIGLRRLAPPGVLARDWHALVHDPEAFIGRPWVDRIRGLATVTFAADGTMAAEGRTP